MLSGELIYQTSDEYGSIEVIEYMQQIRAMHFGNKTQQSANLLCNPFFLVHKYAQAMTLPLCWIKPKRVLVLGLGAGSIVKYLYNYHPNIIIDAVELRPKVTEVAIKYFSLPETDEHFTIFNDSADNWLKLSNENEYDLIIVDVFLTSNTDIDITVDVSSSFNNIHDLLSGTGVAVFNHLGNDVYSYPGFNRLSNIFNENAFYLDIESTNSIIITSRTSIPHEIKQSEFDRLSLISTLPYHEYFHSLKSIIT
ncbi:MAG: hypothetical protein DIZ80_06505 [endosymbiont of Galathealinum brachiosum]|uniref:PABS domain-containing protein n=1 Tax=endosymbiont of Galathealinum brachiosum TaxID=2200906 RepID=A0A370DFT3_9GAMM|nr:MAG: hypothetical protein DIZ80_06505 [endosymbiont of Galathealinum brachiosum]